MRNRAAIVYALLSVLCIAFIAWQIAEHKRVVEAARQNLMSRGRTITGTLGLLIRSQRRWGGIISQERIEAALAELIKPGDVESITLLNAENKVVVSAGVHVLSPGQKVTIYQGKDAGASAAAASAAPAAEAASASAAK